MKGTCRVRIHNSGRSLSPLLLYCLLSFASEVHAAIFSFANTNPIGIPSAGAATPYPSTISVTGVAGRISKITVSLTNLTHTWPDDLDILLVGPSGQTVMLMSDAGGSVEINNVTLTFDDAALFFFPDSSQISSGVFLPSDYDSGEALPAPAPIGPYGASQSVFNGTNPNGTWRLFVYDDTAGDSGSIAGGWSLRIADDVPAVPAANDNFSNRVAMVGSSTTVIGSSDNATKETGEPDHAGNTGGHSVWWTWTALTDGRVTMSTQGSDFDTLLAVYTGTAVSNLTLLTGNDDDINGGNTSLVTFNVAAGTVVHIAVDGYLSASGSIVLSLSLNAGRFVNSDIPREDFWLVDGPVNAIAETNGMIYLGGHFNYVAPNSGRGSALNIYSGTRDPEFPRVDSGYILATIADGRGGWLVGGSFNSVNGMPYTNLVHIRSDKTVDPDWKPNPNGSVFTLAMSEDTVYVGGYFGRIDGQPRISLAALEATTGRAKPWNADVFYTGPVESGEVWALAVAGNTVYVGGGFNAIGGQPRNSIAAVNTATGQVLPWNPDGDGLIKELILSGNTLFIGGDFGYIDGQFIRNLAAVDATTGRASSRWLPDPDGRVETIVVSCNTAYVGGEFRSIGGQPRNYIAAVDINTGLATAWNPDASVETTSDISAPTVGVILIAGSTMYVGGNFTGIGGQPRHSVAALDLDTGRATAWNPEADRAVFSIAMTGSTVLVGGALAAGGLPRKNLLALDATTGRPTPWNPGADAAVSALAASSTTIYVGGSFTNIGGQQRNRIAALNTTTGAGTAWNPNADGTNVSTLVLSGNVVYVAGDFTNIGGQARNGLAALEANSDNVSAWHPVPGGPVTALAIANNRIYVGGFFTNFDGQPRYGLAAVDATTGNLTAWDPNGVGEAVAALVATSNTVYVAGTFTFAGGQSRDNIAAVDTSIGNATTWNPQDIFPVSALAVSRDLVFVAESFWTGFEDLSVIDTLDGMTGKILTSSLIAGVVDAPRVAALMASTRTIYVGGNFLTVGRVFRPFFAAMPLQGAPTVIRQPLSQSLATNQSATFTVEARGLGPLFYQWLFNGMPLPGATNASLIVPNAQVVNSGQYRTIVTNALGLISSIEANLTVLEPVAITIQPASQTVPPGSDVTFTVTASGNPPPTYQWRLNGVNIPGAVFPTLTLANAQSTDGGQYGVVVANGTGAVSSPPADLLVLSPLLPLADNFANRVTNTAISGVGRGSSLTATIEAGEPHHAGKAGGKSVWYAWQAPADGIATFSTRGSGFDTLLAVYTNDLSLNPQPSTLNLVPVASDDDRGGYLTSQVAFNALAGTVYISAIDGFGGASGNIVLSWNLDTTVSVLPRIITQPSSQTVPAGTNATLAIAVNSPTPVRYQWFRHCVPVPFATNATLMVSNVQPALVGSYRVQITNSSGGIVESQEAFLEIGPFKDGLSQDKLEDALVQARQRLVPQSASGWRRPHDVPMLSAGTLGTQILNNIGSATEAGETNHAGVVGGASRWFILHAETSGTMQVDTIGSEIDTVLAVYTGTDLLNLALVASDNNGAPDGVRSRVSFAALAGTDYLIAVDGVNGAQGTIQLNWLMPGLRLNTAADAGSAFSNGNFRLSFNAVAGQNLVIEASTNLSQWLRVYTNSGQGGQAEFLDASAPDHRRRFYRARLEP